MNTIATGPYKTSDCPSEKALSIIDGKWNLKILLSLTYEGTLRFGELKTRMPGITQRMLTAKLRELEDRGVVARKVYPVIPPKVEYSLTDLGNSLKSVLEALREWSLAHDSQVKTD